MLSPRPSSATPLKAAVTVLTSMLALALCFASSAPAATYSVYACEGPDAQSLPNSAWLTAIENPTQALQFSFGTTCGALSVAASTTDPLSHGEGAGWVFDAPAGTAISGYRLVRSASAHFATPGTPTASAGVRESDGPLLSDRDCNNVAVDCNVASSVLERSGLALDKLASAVHCTALGGCPAGTFDALSATLVSARVDLEDPHAPVVAAVTGSLPGSVAVAGVRSIDVTTTDLGGGVAAVELLIDGGAPRSIRPGGNCNQPYVQRQPCPPGTLAQFSLNTAELTNGDHTGQVRAVDAAGNVSASANFTFSVTAGGRSDGAVAPVNGAPAVEQAVVSTMRRVISTARGRSANVTGRLTTPAGQPIVGATLEVSSTDLGVFNSAPRPLGSTTTGAGGSFSFAVRPRGAQRVEVLFRPSPNSLGTAVTSTVVRESLLLTAKVARKRVKPKRLMRMSGRLRGAGPATRGTPIEIDVKIGRRWRAVDVVTANSRGNFRWHYRFKRVSKPTRFVFRAGVRRNSAWPWPTKWSKQVRVVVAR